MNADDICSAFCQPISLRPIPIGYVLRTPFRRADGDPVAVYIRRDETSLQEQYRLEDDGQTIGFLETSGVDLDAATRMEALADMLRECNAYYNQDEVVIHTDYMSEAEIPMASVLFTALMVRLHDLLLLSINRVRSTFRDDLIEMVKRQFGEGAVEVNKPLAESMKDYVIDIVVRAADQRALAIFAATSEIKALEALLFQLECKQRRIDTVRSMLVLESAKPRDIRTRTLSRVMNSDLTLASMDGEEIAIRRKMQDSLAYH
jgi:hypothetical protein